MRIDQALTGQNGELVSQVNQWLSTVEIRTHQILCREENLSGQSVHYGYAQFLEPQDTGQQLSSDEARQYFRELGGLMGYSLLVGLADLHPQNVISRDGGMYLVDTETAFHRPLLNRLAEEIEKPETAFIRGLEGSSIERSCLHRVCQDFYRAETSECSVSLVNGELIDAEVQTFSPAHLAFNNGGWRNHSG